MTVKRKVFGLLAKTAVFVLIFRFLAFDFFEFVMYTPFLSILKSVYAVFVISFLTCCFAYLLFQYKIEFFDHYELMP